MKISKAIKQLQMWLDEYGDRELTINRIYETTTKDGYYRYAVQEPIKSLENFETQVVIYTK